MSETRTSPACTVFEGKVVVSGGSNNLDGTKTVEAYNHIADKWSYMPNMIERRRGHSSVAIKNKLFVIGSCNNNKTETCEVFDSNSKTFMYLKKKPTPSTFSLDRATKSFSIGNKIIILRSWSPTALCYDVEKDEFSEEPFEVSKGLNGFSCTVVPKLKF